MYTTYREQPLCDGFEAYSMQDPGGSLYIYIELFHHIVACYCQLCRRKCLRTSLLPFRLRPVPQPVIACFALFFTKCIENRKA